MPRPGAPRERRERKESFQSFSKPKVKATRTSQSGRIYIDYKDTESLRKTISGNGKILGRKRTGATAMEQRMLAKAVKRARYAAELAGRVLPDRRDDAQRFADRLAEAQDQLGLGQDAAFAEVAIRSTMRGRGVAYAFEAGRLVERQRARSAAARAEFLDSWPELKKRRWRKWAS